MGLQRQRENQCSPQEDPQPGIWYIFPKISGWEIQAFPYVPDSKSDHAAFWKLYLASSLAKSMGGTPGEIASRITRLNECPYALPRGVLSICDGKPVMHWGNDIHPAFGLAKGSIERAFRAEGNATWLEDKSMRCRRSDQLTLCGMLKYQPFWPSDL